MDFTIQLASTMTHHLWEDHPKSKRAILFRFHIWKCFDLVILMSIKVSVKMVINHSSSQNSDKKLISSSQILHI
jgi:hypothetical protein